MQWVGQYKSLYGGKVKNLEERVEKAIDYLVETDKEAAKLKAMMVYREDMLKTVNATLTLEFDEKTVAEREARALSNPKYKYAIDKKSEAIYEYETMKNRRLSAQLVVEVWRTESANERKGNV